MINKYKTLSSEELRARMKSGSFFPEPTESDLIVTSATSMISILHRGVDQHHKSARQQLNRWLAQWDFAEVKNIVMLLTSEKEHEHEGAKWELYLNSLFRHLGFSVKHEPLSLSALGNKKAPSPDFLIEKDGSSLLVEAVTISRSPKETEKKLWTNLLGYLQKHRRADFWIGIHPITSTVTAPKQKKILAKINTYLDLYDSPTHISGDPEVFESFRIRIDGWEFEIDVYRMPQGEPFDSFVGTWGNLDSGAITDTSDLRSQIIYKRANYGKDLPHKFVIAVLENSFMGGLNEVHRLCALFGDDVVNWNPNDDSTSRGRRENGIWNNGKIDTQLSGLLLLAGMSFASSELPLPEFWSNPHMDDALHGLFPFSVWRADSNTYSKTVGLECWNPLT